MLKCVCKHKSKDLEDCVCVCTEILSQARQIRFTLLAALVSIVALQSVACLTCQQFEGSGRGSGRGRGQGSQSACCICLIHALCCKTILQLINKLIHCMRQLYTQHSGTMCMFQHKKKTKYDYEYFKVFLYSIVACQNTGKHVFLNNCLTGYLEMQKIILFSIVYLHLF